MVLEDPARSNVQEEREKREKTEKETKQHRSMVQSLEVIGEGGGWSRVERRRGEEEFYNETHVR